MGYDHHECNVLNGRELTILKISINLLKFHCKRDSVIISKFSRNILNLSKTNWMGPSPGSYTGILRDFLRSIVFICVLHWNIGWNTVCRRVSRKEHMQWKNSLLVKMYANFQIIPFLILKILSQLFCDQGILLSKGMIN
jgi:hypothetical protein